MSSPSAVKEDSALSYLMLGYVLQAERDFQQSNSYFHSAALISSSTLASEARYQVANNLFLSNQYAEAEKEAIHAIEEGGSNEKWITRAYMLLADLFIVQKDYFNAKATLKSVIEHCSIAFLKNEATEKLKMVEAEEKSSNKKSEKK